MWDFIRIVIILVVKDECPCQSVKCVDILTMLFCCEFERSKLIWLAFNLCDTKGKKLSGTEMGCRLQNVSISLNNDSIYLLTHLISFVLFDLFSPLSLIPFVSSSLLLFPFIWQSFVFTTPAKFLCCTPFFTIFLTIFLS